MSEIKIGDTLWCHGRFRSEWASQAITGETKQSWLLGDPKFTQSRVNKKTMIERDGRFRGSDLRWFTAEQMEDRKFIDAHRHHIVSAVGAMTNRAALETIARIAGYTVESPTCS